MQLIKKNRSVIETISLFQTMKHLLTVLMAVLASCSDDCIY